MLSQPQSTPEPSGDSAPKGSQKSPFPVDDADVASVFDGTDDFSCHFFGFQHHGVSEVAAQEVGIYEAWSYVSEVDAEFPVPRLL